MFETREGATIDPRELNGIGKVPKATPQNANNKKNTKAEEGGSLEKPLLEGIPPDDATVAFFCFCAVQSLQWKGRCTRCFQLLICTSQTSFAGKDLETGSAEVGVPTNDQSASTSSSTVVQEAKVCTLFVLSSTLAAVSQHCLDLSCALLDLHAENYISFLCPTVRLLR